jgi:hypothetical protein
VVAQQMKCSIETWEEQKLGMPCNVPGFTRGLSLF